MPLKENTIMAFNRKSLGLDESAIERIMRHAFPIGSFMWWFGKQSKIPSGWIICDGRSIATYPDLVEVLGSNVAPNLVGTYTYIKGSTTPMVYQAASLPDHQHYITFARDQFQGIRGNAGFGDEIRDGTQTVITGAASETEGIYGRDQRINPNAPKTVTPPNVSAIPIMKAQ